MEVLASCALTQHLPPLRGQVCVSPESAGGPAPLAQEAKEQLEGRRICPGGRGVSCSQGGGWEVSISCGSPEPGTSQDVVESRLTARGLGLWGFPAAELVPTVVSRHRFPLQSYPLTPPWGHLASS